jgi:hypothetical protein
MALDWTREEDILAMDLYVRAGACNGGSIPGAGSREIIQLSEMLKKLSAYPPDRQEDKYRNPDGVYLKLMNLRSVETDGVHGMPRGSKVDAAVWRDYVDNLPELHAEAETFRLRLQDRALRPARSKNVTEDVEVERQHTETFIVNPSGEQRAAERAEQRLVLSYRDHMAGKSIRVCRKKYLPAGEVRPIFSDAWVPARNALIEAKNSDSRDALRMAIGQLYDYRRFHQSQPHLAVLLPYPPTGDRLDLLRSAHIEALWPHGSGFRASARGAFV